MNFGRRVSGMTRSTYKRRPPVIVLPVVLPRLLSKEDELAVLAQPDPYAESLFSPIKLALLARTMHILCMTEKPEVEEPLEKNEGEELMVLKTQKEYSLRSSVLEVEGVGGRIGPQNSFAGAPVP